MQVHLESGCVSCARTFQVWLSVLEVAAGLDTYTPPERGVRFVKALYHVCPPRKTTNLRLAVSRMVFPAGAGAIPTGLRADEFSRRHFLFQRDNLVLDVHVEVAPGSRRISMAGQIMDTVAPSVRFADRPVILMSGKTEMVKASTNQFGEFHLEIEPADDLMLVIHLGEDSVLVTPLPSLVTAPAPTDSGLELRAGTRHAS